MPKKLILFPFGGNAREALLSILDINKAGRKWDILGFIDDDPSAQKKSCCGIKVLGGREVLKRHTDTMILAVPGNPDTYLMRRQVINDLAVNKARFATVIHPSATVSPDACVGYNTLVMSNVVISCGVNIGNHVVILPNTVVSHDSVVGDHCLIGSNVSMSGNVTLGAGCYIGSGARIRERISIGERSLIGMGSIVISDVEKDVVVAGNPARTIRKEAK